MICLASGLLVGEQIRAEQNLCESALLMHSRLLRSIVAENIYLTKLFAFSRKCLDTREKQRIYTQVVELYQSLSLSRISFYRLLKIPVESLIKEYPLKQALKQL
jgi:hypothetical protein